MTEVTGTVDRVLNAVCTKNANVTVSNKKVDLAVLTSDSNESWLPRNVRESYSKAKFEDNQSLMSKVGKKIDSKIISFYGNIEERAEAMCSGSPAALDNLNLEVDAGTGRDAGDDETVKTEYRVEVEVLDQAKPRWSLMSIIGCQPEIVDDTLDTIYDDGFSLNTFTQTDTFTHTASHTTSPRFILRGHPDFMTPRAQSLMKEIEDIENSCIDVGVKETESFEAMKHSEIKAMAAIKKYLLEQQEFLKGAPEDVKRDFYQSVSRAAMLNAEVAARQAELELKKIRLESLQVQEELDRLSGGHKTFDSSVDGSEISRGLNCLPTFKVQKNRKALATAE